MSFTAPARIAASLILMPAALTSTRTSPTAGAGRGTSRTSRTSTPPYESNCTALLIRATVVDLRDVSSRLICATSRRRKPLWHQEIFGALHTSTFHSKRWPAGWLLDWSTPTQHFH